MRSRADLIAAVVSLLPLTAHAEGFALAAKAGSMGIGGEATIRLTDRLNVRLGGGAFNYDYDSTLSDVDYTLGLNLKGGGAALDFHPGGGAFRLSAGLLLHGNELTGFSDPTTSVHIGDHRYEPSQIGRLSVKADYKRRVAPFATLGIGNGGHGKGMFLSLEAGVALTRKPAVTVNTSLSAPGLAEDLRLEEQNVNEDLGYLKLYPMVSVGIGLRL
jgi:hypothetical protein